MNILHICSDYAKQSIYNNMVSALNECALKQIVYVPVRTAAEIGSYQNNTLQHTTYHFSHILRKYHRLLFHLKTRTVFKDLIKKIDVQSIDLVHAHFLFSDGAVALRLKQQFGKEYVVAVRNTDINVFFRYMKHLRSLAFKILLEAKEIVFVTPSYKDKLLNEVVPEKIASAIRHKCTIIPNGIDQFWLNNAIKKTSAPTASLKLLYVGDFSTNKNIPSIVAAAKCLSLSRLVHLTIIGGGGDGADAVSILTSAEKELVTVLPRISKKEELMQHYRNADIFVMPSFYETFGLVFIEALSQGVPVIYTKGQGIDGYFSEGQVGFHVNPRELSDLIQKINAVAEAYTSISANTIEAVQMFNWKLIAKTYTNIYKR